MTTAQTALRRPRLSLGLLATAQFIIAVDYNIVYVALPSIGTDLGFSLRHLQWVISAYALAFGGLLLLGGRLGDVFGRRRAFVTALILYGMSSLAGGFATEPALLITARAIQGIGGALLFPATLALVATYFAEGTARHRALAVVGAAGASGGASGALLGGLLTSHWGWSATFFVNVPFAMAAAALAFVLLPRDETPATHESVDIPGAITATGAIVLLVLACVEGPERGWGSASILGMFAGSAVLLILFLIIESRTKRPLLPLRLLRHPMLTIGMAVASLFASSFGAQYFLLTTYLQDVRHYAPSMAGIAFLPFSLSIVLGTRLATRLVARIGLRNALATGLLLGITGLLMVAGGLSANGGYAAHLLPGFLLDGVGQGITWTLMWVVATSGIEARDRGVASGMASTAQQVGNALGLALLVAIATASLPATEAHDPARIIGGLRTAFLVAAGLATAALSIVLLRVRTPRPVVDTTPAPL